VLHIYIYIYIYIYICIYDISSLRVKYYRVPHLVHIAGNDNQRGCVTV